MNCRPAGQRPHTCKQTKNTALCCSYVSIFRPFVTWTIVPQSDGNRVPPGTLNPLEVIMAPLLMITNAGGGLVAHISQHLLPPACHLNQLQPVLQTRVIRCSLFSRRVFFLLSPPLVLKAITCNLCIRCGKMFSIKLRSSSSGPRLPFHSWEEDVTQGTHAD